jgi:hypothetical protein
MEFRFHPACEPHGPPDQPRWMLRFCRAALARGRSRHRNSGHEDDLKVRTTLSIVRVVFPLRQNLTPVGHLLQPARREGVRISVLITAAISALAFSRGRARIASSIW